MDVGPAELALAASEGARVVALRLLDDAATAASKLDQRGATEDEANALHDFRVAVRRLRSWIDAFDDELGDVIPGKVRRRLAKLARATNSGRDREVQIEWLDRAGTGARGSRRAAVAWLRDHFGRSDAQARDDLRSTVRRKFPKARDAIVRALTREVPVFDSPLTAVAALPTPTLGQSIADRIGPHVVAFHEAAASIQSVGDEGAAHATRIAVKRFRYLIEPARAVDGVDDLLGALRGLQDALGTLHDGHVLARELSKLTRQCAAADARLAAAKALGAELAPARKRDVELAGVPRAGLVSVMRRLRTDIRAAYADARRRYDAPGLEELAALTDRVRVNLSSGRAVSSAGVVDS
jgi:CHAD domain-containing protein